MKDLIIIQGPQGCGKSTLSKLLSADKSRKFRTVGGDFLELVSVLRPGETVILETCSEELALSCLQYYGDTLEVVLIKLDYLKT